MKSVALAAHSCYAAWRRRDAKAFSENQRKAAAEIEAIFVEGSKHHVLLNADVQSGKTGTFHCVIRHMLQANMVSRVYILCGTTDTELYEQARLDALRYNYDLADRIYVIFRQDLNKYDLEPQSTLIVVDESHMDQSNNNILAKKLERHGLAMDGTREAMVTNKTYILSVSATAFSELAAHKLGKSRPKAVVYLEPSAAYFGPAKYYATYEADRSADKSAGARLKPTFDIFADEASELRFLGLFKPHTWNLMRIPGGSKGKREAFVSAMETLCADNDIDVFRFDSKRSEIVVACESCNADGGNDACTTEPCLSHRPPRSALVLIDGRLRAGKVVPKAHIGFVWEGATNAKTDAFIQGLFGRMCGHYPVGTEVPLVFVPNKAFKKCSGMNEIERHLACHVVEEAITAIPTKATNLTGIVNIKEAGHGKTQCSPVKFNIAAEKAAASEASDAATTGMLLRSGVALRDYNERDWLALKSIALAKLKAVAGREIVGHRGLSAGQKDEILTGLDGLGADETFRRSDGQTKYIKELIKAHNAHTITREHMSTPKFLTFVFPKADQPGLVEGDVFAVFYTDATGDLAALPRGALISDVRKGCSFLTRELKVAAEAAADAAVSFPDDKLETPTLFKEGLQSVLDTLAFAEERNLLTTNTLSFRNGANVFPHSQFDFVSPTNNAIRRILDDLEPAYHLRFKITYAKHGPGGKKLPKKSLALQAISWKSTLHA